VHEPEEVNQLTGTESGCWRVFTRDSIHLFDFDAQTVKRIPGPNAWPTFNDRARPLRSIDACAVGARGHWTMFEDGWSETVEFYWHDTSIIQRIEQVQVEADEPE
jgi:hypothetical protein